MTPAARGHAPPTRPSRRRRPRASERGAVIFVVILVLAVLTAIGVFAAHEAGLNQRVSGYSRQSTQNGYVADYAAMALAGELSGPRKQAYVDQLKSASEQCASLPNLADGGVNPPCYKVTAAEFQQRLQQDGLSDTYFDPDGGSFGVSNTPVVGDFVVEMTDPGPAGGKVPGTQQDDRARGFQNMQYTLTATGQVRPTSVANADPDAGVCNTPTEQESAQVSGTRSMRVYVTVPYVSQ